MCEPATIALTIMAVGTAVSTVSSFQQQKAANKAAEFQAAVATNNQIAANQYAEDAKRRAAQQASDHRKRISAVKADQTAAMAAAGFDVGQGSALDILGDTAAAGELDILRIKDAGEREAAKFRQQGSNFGAEAQLYANSTSSPFLAAGSSLLAGASKFSTAYAGYSQNKQIG